LDFPIIYNINGRKLMSMSEINVGKTEIKKFVRQHLGCACDDKVFESIGVEYKPENKEIVEAGYLIKIGGQLLIYLVKPYAWKHLVDSLEKIFMWGRDMRDRGGYNRFRLVVVTSDSGLAKEELEQIFNGLQGIGERLHLHIIQPDEAPL
jgi:hypothetical protein